MKLPAFASLHALNILNVANSFTRNGANLSYLLPAGLLRRPSTRSAPPLGMTIVSPFANNTDNDPSGDDFERKGVATATYTPLPSDDEPLDLTWENVDLVLEEMRPYLLQDGGNVAISEIDGPVVKLELQVCILQSIAHDARWR